MKIVIYLLLFLGILGVVGFGFFTMSMPHIEQTTVTVNIDPKDAFVSPSPAAAPVPSTASSVPDSPAP